MRKSGPCEEHELFKPVQAQFSVGGKYPRPSRPRAPPVPVSAAGFLRDSVVQWRPQGGREGGRLCGAPGRPRGGPLGALPRGKGGLWARVVDAAAPLLTLHGHCSGLSAGGRPRGLRRRGVPSAPRPVLSPLPSAPVFLSLRVEATRPCRVDVSIPGAATPVLGDCALSAGAGQGAEDSRKSLVPAAAAPAGAGSFSFLFISPAIPRRAVISGAWCSCVILSFHSCMGLCLRCYSLIKQ